MVFHLDLFFKFYQLQTIFRTQNLPNYSLYLSLQYSILMSFCVCLISSHPYFLHMLLFCLLQYFQQDQLIFTELGILNVKKAGDPGQILAIAWWFPLEFDIFIIVC